MFIMVKINVFSLHAFFI